MQNRSKALLKEAKYAALPASVETNGDSKVETVKDDWLLIGRGTDLGGRCLCSGRSVNIAERDDL